MATRPQLTWKDCVPDGGTGTGSQENLSRSGEIRDARSNVHRRAEPVTLAADGHPGVHPDAHPQRLMARPIVADQARRQMERLARVG